MTRWEVYSGSDEDWNQNVCNKNAHYRQLTFWGNLKKKKNWKILRLKCTNGETTSIQIFYKKDHILQQKKILDILAAYYVWKPMCSQSFSLYYYYFVAF